MSKMVWKKRGRGTPHISFEGIFSDVQTMVGTQHKILRYFKCRGGTPHIRFKVIWLDILMRLGTPHRHRVECIQQENPYGRWVVVLSGNITTLFLQTQNN